MPASANAMARKARVWRSGERNKITRNGGGEGEFSPAEGKGRKSRDDRRSGYENSLVRSITLCHTLSATCNCKCVPLLPAGGLCPCFSGVLETVLADTFLGKSDVRTFSYVPLYFLIDGNKNIKYKNCRKSRKEESFL